MGQLGQTGAHRQRACARVREMTMQERGMPKESKMKKESVDSFYPAPVPEKSRNRRNKVSSNCS
jgi:hypothetical protein